MRERLSLPDVLSITTICEDKMKTKKSKLILVICIAVAALLAASAVLYFTVFQEHVLGGIELVSPKKGAKDIHILNDIVLEYWDFPDEKLTASEIYTLCEAKCKDNHGQDPAIITLEWQGTSYEYIVKLGKKSDLSDAVEYVTKETKLELSELYSGTKYYWKVLSADGKCESYTFNFKTAYDSVRTVLIDGVINTRDIGGLKTEKGSKRIKQGMVYRGAGLTNITEQGKKDFTGKLGIKTELNLADEHEAPKNKTWETKDLFITCYEAIFNTSDEYRNNLRDCIKLFANKDNYPIYFHCMIGRDRTGTLGFFIEQICGISDTDIKREFFLTPLAYNDGSYMGDGFMWQEASMKTFRSLLKTYGNGNVRENSLQYLRDIGVTDEEMDNIRDILLESY